MNKREKKIKNILKKMVLVFIQKKINNYLRK